MKRCLTVVLAASLFAALGSVAQAEQGMPSQATLRAMGLSGMQVMNDFEAMSVRGMGFQQSGHSTAIAFGISYAKINGHDAEAGSIDGYYAEGKHHAAGAHGSYAGKVEITKTSGGKGGKGHGDKGRGGKGGKGGMNGGGHNGPPAASSSKGHKGGGPKGGDRKGGGPKGGGHMGGGPKGGDHNGGSHKGGGHKGGGGKVQVKATIVFAGGYAVSSAY